MPIWLILLLGGGGIYLATREKASPKPSDSSGKGESLTLGGTVEVPPTEESPSWGEKLELPKESILETGIGTRTIVDRIQHWPEGDICEAAIKGLPYDKRLNPFTKSYTDPSIREMALKAAESDNAAGLRAAAGLVSSPEFLDAYKFAAECLIARADKLDPPIKESTPTWGSTKSL